MKKHLFAVSLVLSLGLVATACGGGGGGGGTSPEPSVKGGVLRESLTDFGFTNAFDPTGEYLGSAWGYYAQMLIRGLVSYPFVSGAAGNEIQADLATDTGTLSADGLTWTFTLKDGVQWGPPLNRPITSQDVAFAFQRINTKSLVAQYGNYYCGVIVGMDCQSDSQTNPISGITTPDDKTIVFQLEQPTGDYFGANRPGDGLFGETFRLDVEHAGWLIKVGADKVLEKLPRLIRAVRQAGRTVVWVGDPMHGNTYQAGDVKTRHFDDVLAETSGFFAVHRALGTWPGGLHIELTGDDVTECLGGVEAVGDEAGDAPAHRLAADEQPLAV